MESLAMGAAAAASSYRLTRASQVDAARTAHLEYLRMEAAAASSRPGLMYVKRRWLREFITELEAVKARPAFRLQQCLDAGRDPEEPLQIPKQDWDAGMVELPNHVAARIRKMTDMTTSVITLSSAVDEGYTQAHVDSALQRMKTDTAGALPHDPAVDADGKPGSDAQAYLLQWFMGKERAVITIQRAFRAFRARCLVHGWPSELDPLIMHRRHQAKARYLEGIARHGGRAALDAKAAVAKLRGLAMVAAEAVATKFEHEAQLRTNAGIMRAPMSGASSEYQLQDREYRIMMLGREFVEQEERQQRMAEELRIAQEQRDLQEQKRREERQARDRQREEQRQARLQSDIALESSTFLDKARRGMMGMSMDGSGQQRAPADAPFSRGRTARVQREAAQEEAERLDALMRAGMGSGEDLLRHAVLGPGAPELLEAIAKAGSMYDVESLVKEEVQRLAALRIQQQSQQQQQHLAQQPGQAADPATDFSPPPGYCQGLPFNDAAFDGEQSGSELPPGTLFIPVPSFSKWRPPNELQPSGSPHDGEGLLFGQHLMSGEHGEAADTDMDVAPRAKSESCIQYMRAARRAKAEMHAKPHAPSPGRRVAMAPLGGPSPMRSRRHSSTSSSASASPSPSPARVSCGGSPQHAVRTRSGGDGILSDARICAGSRPRTAGAALMPRKSPLHSGIGAHRERSLHADPGSPPLGRRPPTGVATGAAAGSVPARPQTAGVPPSPMRARSQPLLAGTAVRPAVAVPEHLEGVVTSNAWWDGGDAHASDVCASHSGSAAHASGTACSSPGAACYGSLVGRRSSGGGGVLSGSGWAAVSPSYPPHAALPPDYVAPCVPASSHIGGASAAAMGQPPSFVRHSFTGPVLASSYGEALVPSLHTVHTEAAVHGHAALDAMRPHTPSARAIPSHSSLVRAYESCRASPPAPGGAAASPAANPGTGPHRKSESGVAGGRKPAPPAVHRPGNCAVQVQGAAAPAPGYRTSRPMEHGHAAAPPLGYAGLVSRPGSGAAGGSSMVHPHSPSTPPAIAGGSASGAYAATAHGAAAAAVATAAIVSQRPPGLPYVSTHAASQHSPLGHAGLLAPGSPPLLAAPYSPAAAMYPTLLTHDVASAWATSGGGGGQTSRSPRAATSAGPRHSLSSSPKAPPSLLTAQMLTSTAASTSSAAANSCTTGVATKRVAFDCPGPGQAPAVAASEGRVVRFALRHSKTSDDVAALMHPRGTGAAAGQHRIERAAAPTSALSALDEGLWRDFVERVGSASMA